MYTSLIFHTYIFPQKKLNQLQDVPAQRLVPNVKARLVLFFSLNLKANMHFSCLFKVPTNPPPPQNFWSEIFLSDTEYNSANVIKFA